MAVVQTIAAVVAAPFVVAAFLWVFGRSWFCLHPVPSLHVHGDYGVFGPDGRVVYLAVYPDYYREEWGLCFFIGRSVRIYEGADFFAYDLEGGRLERIASVESHRSFSVGSRGIVFTHRAPGALHATAYGSRKTGLLFWSRREQARVNYEIDLGQRTVRVLTDEERRALVDEAEPIRHHLDDKGRSVKFRYGPRTWGHPVFFQLTRRVPPVGPAESVSDGAVIAEADDLLVHGIPYRPGRSRKPKREGAP